VAHVLAVAAGLLVQEELELAVALGVRGGGAGNRSRGGWGLAFSNNFPRERTMGRTNCVLSQLT